MAKKPPREFRWVRVGEVLKPRNGAIVQVLLDHYWVMRTTSQVAAGMQGPREVDEVLFFGNNTAPQANLDRRIVEMVARNNPLAKGAYIVKLPQAFVEVDPTDLI